ncbi:MAG: Omp28-related outer membrane protein [Prevotella sp.]|nr:Omp28-related outer membrane protein [Prevotella sp.]
MRKIFTLFVLLVAAVTAMAQDANTFQFVNQDGNSVDGQTVTVSELTEDPFGSDYISSGLSVKNTSTADAKLLVNYEITAIDNGAYQICFPVNCISKTETGSFSTEAGTLSAGEVKSLQSEWLPEAYGQCKVTLKIDVLNGLGTKVADGPTVNVIFNNANPAVQSNWWGYVENNATTEGLGVNTVDKYHCAIFIPGDNAVAAGKSIKTVRFGLLAAHATNIRAWVATSLPSTISTSTCLDVVDVPTSMIGNKNIDAEFAAPVAIPASGIYVGYSFNITATSTQNDQYPVLTTGDDMAKALILRTETQVPSWSDLNGQGFGRLYLQVLLEGEFGENVAVPADLGDVYVQTGTTGTANLTITNAAGNQINSIDYTVNGGAEQHADLTTPINFNESTTVSINVTAEAEQSITSKTVTVTKVNGNDNTAADKTADFTLYSLDEIIPRNVVVEEFTGTGCGWCPRGMIGMQNLRNTYGDRFVGIAVHQYNSSDAMYIATNSYARLGFSGAPSCTIDRKYITDPYYGTGDDIRDDFLAEMNIPSLASVNVSGMFNAESTQVEATAQVKALFDSQYKLEFVLIADDLSGTGSAWNQSNYYYQYSASQLPEDLRQFGSGGVNGRSSVTGWHFDDVALASSYVSGTNRVPALTLTSGEEQGASYTLTLPTKTTLKNALNTDKIYVIALVVDNNGTIVNAAKSKVEANPTGVEAIRSDAAVTVEAYFTPDGRQLSAPQPGLNIVRMSDGTVRKVVIK